MNIAKDALWAKKRDEGGLFKWLSLEQHLRDTMGICMLLWEHWLSYNQKKLIMDSIKTSSENDARQLIGFLGAVHDFGKASAVFQSSPSYVTSKDLDIEILLKLEKYGFKDISNFYESLNSPRSTPHAFVGQALLENLGVNKDISSIVGAHHGMPANNRREIKSQLMSYRKNIYQDTNKDSEVYKMWDRCHKEVLERALKENGYGEADDLPSISQSGQVILSGLLIMADWISSNEKYFPLVSLEKNLVSCYEERLEKAWLSWFKTWPQNMKLTKTVDLLYQERFGKDFSPRDVQRKFSEIINSVDNPGIFILEAPMGVGKTEAALVGVEQISGLVGTSGMFFGLPTQATSDGIFPRIRKWASSYSDERKSIQLVHGKAALNESFISLPRDINIYDESDDLVMVNQWFSGRKTAVLDDYVIGTIDQFLMMTLKQKHLMLRHLGFSKKVIIIDEVHAYDAYMSQYLYTALRWLGAYSVPVIILSATLPGIVRKKLLESYMLGKGLKKSDIEIDNNFSCNDEYPLISYSDGFEAKQFSSFEKMESRDVEVIELAEKDLVNVLEDELRDGGVAGVIVNTVKRSQEFSKLLRKKFGFDNVSLLHSSFISIDRIEKEKRLLDEIGRGANRPKFKIIVGTQVIEQSLDIDFDLLISDLAPMDLLIQRMGRLHRHKNVKRPRGLEKPKFFVMGKDENFKFDEGSIAVYGLFLLIRTQILLPNTLEIPGDISTLVQKVYSKSLDINLNGNHLAIYEEASRRHQGKIREKEAKAKTFRLGGPKFSKKANLVGWLKDKGFHDSEEKGLAQVRDTDETVEVIAVKKLEEGYGFFNCCERLDQSIDSIDTQKEIAKHTLRLPGLLTKSYNIGTTIDYLENYNRKNLPMWQYSNWLKGSLGIIFNEEGEFLLGNYLLSYDSKEGLTYKRRD